MGYLNGNGVDNESDQWKGSVEAAKLFGISSNYVEILARKQKRVKRKVGDDGFWKYSVTDLQKVLKRKPKRLPKAYELVEALQNKSLHPTEEDSSQQQPTEHTKQRFSDEKTVKLKLLAEMGASGEIPADAACRKILDILNK
jgi:hypothetical protein